MVEAVVVDFDDLSFKVQVFADLGEEIVVMRKDLVPHFEEEQPGKPAPIPTENLVRILEGAVEPERKTK